MRRRSSPSHRPRGRGRRDRPRQHPGTGRARRHHARDRLPRRAGRVPAQPSRRVRFLEPASATSTPDPLATAASPSSRASAGSSRRMTCWPASSMAVGRRGLGGARVDGVPPLSTGSARAPRARERTPSATRCLTELCPANPDVRAYVRALSDDIARHGVADNRRRVAPLPPARARLPPRALLPPSRRRAPVSCSASASASTASRAPGRPASTVQQCGAGPGTRSSASSTGARTHREELDEAEARAWPAGELGGYLDARADAVASLVADAAAAAADEGAAFAFLDASGAVKGYADGRACRRPCRGDRLAARRRPGRRGQGLRAARGDRLRGRPGPRPARPRGLPGAASARRIALGRHAPDVARLRFHGEPRREAATSRASSGSSASTCTTTASLRSRPSTGSAARSPPTDRRQGGMTGAAGE